tara:strand:- start:150 stop:401 length:252 start_codon:yes stop_codon:yes gene_type:complete
MSKLVRYFNYGKLNNINKYLKKNPVEKKLLGRWGVDHDQYADIKADHTNEDHCGVCNSMREEYIKKNDEKNKPNDEYEKPFLL